MLYHPHPPTNLEVKVTDLRSKVFRSGYLLNLCIVLADTLLNVRYWSKILCCSIPTPHLLTDLEVKVTDLEFFMVNEMFMSHHSVIRKNSSFKYKNLVGSASIP